MRMFNLERDTDVSGVSGTGTVAKGVEFDDGTVAIRWAGRTPSTVTWESVDHAMAVHGHNGATRLVWLDAAGNPVDAVYVSIGNSDDKLSQRRWSEFHMATDALIRTYAAHIHGAWVSAAHAPYQNAAWCFEPSDADVLKESLRVHAQVYDQDSIAWAEARTTFIEPTTIGV